MANDPRKTFSVSYCPATKQQQVNQGAGRKGFLDGLGKIGNLEVLNDIGLGKVGKGLRVLSSVSDAVRVGSSSVPGRIGDELYNSTLGKIVNTGLEAVNKGAEIVLETTGLGGVADVVKDFNPGVANRAYGQAKVIYDQVKKGNYKLSDIPGTFQDLQNLEILGRGIFGGQGGNEPSRREYEFCGASPYAVDLISYAPKFKFLFVVEVTFAPEYAKWNGIASQMSFVVKTSTRPKMDVEYDEINMYNFRTRVAKKITYPAINMSFYDDNKNAAHLFYTAYMRAMSPITNIVNPTNYMYEDTSTSFNGAAHTRTFDEQGPNTKGYSASLGLLNNNTMSLLSRIRLYHVFDYGRLMNIYNFYNPRIQTFTPSDLSMLETGEGADFEFDFLYDGLFIEPGFSVQEGGNNSNLEDITANGGRATYPIKPIFNDDDQPSDNSQQGLNVPIAQEQLTGDSTSNYVGNFTGDNLIASNGSVDLSNIAGGINGKIGDIAGKFTETVDGVVGSVNQVIGDATALANNAISDVTGAVGNFVGNAVNSVFTPPTSTASGVAGSDATRLAAAEQSQNGGIINNISSGVTGAYNTASKTVSNAYSSASKFAGSLFS